MLAKAMKERNAANFMKHDAMQDASKMDMLMGDDAKLFRKRDLEKKDAHNKEMDGEKEKEKDTEKTEVKNLSFKEKEKEKEKEKQQDTEKTEVKNLSFREKE